MVRCTSLLLARLVHQGHLAPRPVTNSVVLVGRFMSEAVQASPTRLTSGPTIVASRWRQLTIQMR
jgi:hypothetical protein